MPKILTVFDLKSIYFIPQSASFAPFSAPVSVNSHLDLLGFKPEKDENMSNTFVTSIKDYFLLEKMWCHHHMLCLKKYVVKYVKVFCVFIFLNRQKNCF